MPRVEGLHRVAIQAPNMEAAIRFYTDLWGLKLISHAPAITRLATGSADYADYIIKMAEGRGLDHLAFRAAGHKELMALVREGQAAGGRLVQPVQAGIDESERFAAEMIDPDGNRVRLLVPGSESISAVAPEFGPERLGHVVLWARNAEAMERFYTGIGLRVSDRTKMGMAFMRCNSDHHTLALAANPNLSGLQHIAFDGVTIDHVMRQLGRLKKAGVSCIWGPGRHGPGNNVFTYYQDPAGTIIEFYGELEQVSTEDVPLTEKFWGPEHSGDLWGLAGPPPNIFKGLPSTT